jgi:hypothetical protein
MEAPQKDAGTKNASVTFPDLQCIREEVRDATARVDEMVRWRFLKAVRVRRDRAGLYRDWSLASTAAEPQKNSA